MKLCALLPFFVFAVFLLITTLFALALFNTVAYYLRTISDFYTYEKSTIKILENVLH